MEQAVVTGEAVPREAGALAWAVAGVLPIAAAALGVAAVGVADGGYYATAWGWSALVLGWIAAISLLVQPHVRFSAPGVVFLLGLLAFVVWAGLSTGSSGDASQAVPELQRGLVYISAAAVLLVLLTRASLPGFLGGVLAGITLVAAYGLGTRLFPERLGVFDPFAGYRLSEPLGYWNALGLLGAMGILLASMFAARAARRALRALAASALVVVVPTVYFTFSRGAWLALAVGLAAMIAFDRRRLQLVVWLLALSVAPGAAVWIGYRSDALTTQGSTLGDASPEGHRLALAIAVLALLEGALALLLSAVEVRVIVGQRLRRLAAIALTVASVAALAGIVAAVGPPATLAREAVDSFRAPAAPAPVDLNERLFSLSGSGRADFWGAAWSDFRDHPWVGSGAGSYEAYWLRHRPSDFEVRDAHSLYLETLAELGVVGLALLLVVAMTPLVASMNARGHSIAPAAFGAYVAYLAHAGVDWDWEMPVVTLCALGFGSALIVAARSEDRPPATLWTHRLVPALVAVMLAVIACAFVGVVGSSALGSASRALEDGRLAEAEVEARKAARWEPWSSRPWQMLADIQRARGQIAGARASLRRAIAKDPGEWSLWLNLAYASHGPARARALAEAARLNPRSPEVAAFRAALRRRSRDQS